MFDLYLNDVQFCDHCILYFEINILNAVPFSSCIQWAIFLKENWSETTLVKYMMSIIGGERSQLGSIGGFHGGGVDFGVLSGILWGAHIVLFCCNNAQLILQATTSMERKQIYALLETRWTIHQLQVQGIPSQCGFD